jgi:hypothetical protein
MLVRIEAEESLNRRWTQMDVNVKWFLRVQNKPDGLKTHAAQPDFLRLSASICGLIFFIWLIG